MDHMPLIRRRLLSMLRNLETAPAGDSGTIRGYLFGYLEGLMLAQLLTIEEHDRIFTLIDDINERRLARI